jgi:N-acetylneuraminic acid mutarotase
MRAVLAGLVLSFVLVGASDAQTGGGQWVSLAPMPSERQEVAAALFNGKIYVIAGYDAARVPTNTVDVYNPATDSWATVQPIPIANDHSSAAAAAGKLYSFGGTRTETFVYDPVNNSWSEVASSLSAHRYPAVGVINDKIYVAGGGSAAMEVYDPIANTWTFKASMSVARNHNPGGVINGKLYVAGGRGTPEAETLLEVYDPATNSWTTLAPMPTGRSGGAAAVVEGELYVMGGEGVQGMYPHVEVYNPGTNTWRRIQDMAVPRHGIVAPVIGNKIYVPAGAVVPDISPTDVTDMFVVTNTATFANISTRLKVETGDNVLIGGFIVTGSVSKRLILRAIGPSLPVSGPLANPRLELYNGTSQLIAVNDDWQSAPNKQEIIDSALAPSQDAEAAILTTVAPGSYTAIVRGEGNTTGVALVEVYDLEPGSEAKLANISTRGRVQTGDDVLIGGLILRGELARRVIVRAIGPSLPVPGALANPTLELRDTNGDLLASNDDWRTTQETEIIATGVPPSHDLESAIVRTLPASNYTAIVRGQGATTGIALVEAYALE